MKRPRTTVRTRDIRSTMHRLASATLVMFLALTVFPGTAEADTFEKPAFVQTIGGQGRPGVFAWGSQYNPVSGEIIVGDYLNYQLRRYDLSGRNLGEFFRADGNGQPYSIAIDPRNGDIYTGEIRDGGSNVVSKYTMDGTHLGTFDVLAGYHAWIAVDHDGYLYISDSHYWDGDGKPRIEKYSVEPDGSSATRIDYWTISKAGAGVSQVPRMYGIDVAEDGTVYAPDSANSVVHSWTNDGTYLGHFGETHFGGDLRGAAIDHTNGLLYISDAQYGEIERFDLAGNHLATIGSLGAGDGELLAPRQPTVGPNGEIIVSDYGKYSAEMFAADGTWLRSIPDPPRRSAVGHFGQPRDVDINDATGEIWVADAWNQRVQRFDPLGTPTGIWGQRGVGLYGMNYPRSVAIDPDTENVWVVNERGHYIAVYSPDMSERLFVVGSEGVDSSGTNYLRWPVDVEFRDGYAFVGDRVSGKVKRFDTTTGLEDTDGSWPILESNHGLAVDPVSGDVFVVNRSADKIVKADSDGNELFSFGSRGSGDGEFENAKDAVVVDGVLWVTDEALSRVQAFDLDGNFLGKFGGYGQGAYDFRNPVGISSDPDGLIYIADSSNDRVSVFDTRTARPLYEFSKPTVDVGSPVQGQQFSASVPISGSAGDNTNVASVEIAVEDVDSGKWWDAHSAIWTDTQTWSLAPASGPPTDRTFDWSFIGVTPGGSYEAQVRSVDEFGSVSDETTRLFSLTEGSVEPDTISPDGTVSTPTSGETFPLGTVALGGQASDNVGVATVEVAIKDSSTSLWWDGSDWGSFTWVDGVLAAPGATLTDWSYDFVAPGAGGNFGMSVRAADAAGNIDETRPWVNFSVTGSVDTTPPIATVAAPTNNETFSLGAITLSGAASDDVAVAAVKIAIKDKTTGMWLHDDGTWAGFAWLDSALSTPDLPETDWSFDFDPPAIGGYAFMVRADDSSGNSQVDKPWVNFSFNDGADTTPPDATVSNPVNNGSYPIGVIDIMGTATDDIELESVKVAIKDKVTGLWWHGSGFEAGFKYIDAVLDDPGATSTDWSYTFDAVVAGEYAVTVRARDAAMNIDPTRPWINFDVE